MKCHEIRKLFPLYFDSEGDAELQLHIGDHLAACDACRQWFSRESRQIGRLEEMLREDPQPTLGLWSRVEERCRPPSLQPGFAWRRWHVAAAVVLSVIVLSTGLVWTSRDTDGHLSAQAASFHEEYVRGARRPALSSNSVEEIERWLGASVGFPVRCPPQGQAKFDLHGADVRQFGDRPGAQILGAVRGRPVSVFVLPGESLAAFPHLRRHLSGEGDRHECREGCYQMVACIRHGHLVMAMGEDSPQVLTEVLRGYGNHSHAVYHPAGVGGIPLTRLSRRHVLGHGVFK